MNPSHTICPESVAVMAALCPADSIAAAKIKAAATKLKGKNSTLLVGKFTTLTFS
jgi:hypothetical protein